jgi:mannose-1-phosphate guanylyltransferase
MQAVVLIGGKGTRLRPITYTVPKAMVPLRNKPYIEYMVDSLRAAGLEGAVFSMGYLPDPIQNHFEARVMNNFSIEYVVEDHPLGTAGGIKNAEEYLEDGPFVVANGDVLVGQRLTEVIEAHQGSGAMATITLTAVENPTAYGLVEVDHQLQVKRFVEKPGSEEMHTSLINAGIYVLEREVLDIIPKGREVSIEREIFPKLQAMGKLRAYISSAYWKDIGTPRNYLTASHDVLSGAVGRTDGFEYLNVHPSSWISKNVALLPPVSIAEECEVNAHATIGARTALSKKCAIGEGAVVEGSVLFDTAQVEEGAVVTNSIVGPGAIVRRNSVVRGLSMLGAGCVIEEGNILDRGIQINPRVYVSSGAISF